MLCGYETVLCTLLAFNIIFICNNISEHRDYLKIFNRPCDGIIEYRKIDDGEHEYQTQCSKESDWGGVRISRDYPLSHQIHAEREDLARLSYD